MAQRGRRRAPTPPTAGILPAQAPILVADDNPARSIEHNLSYSTGFSGKGCHRSAKPSGGEDLDIEEPVASR